MSGYKMTWNSAAIEAAVARAALNGLETAADVLLEEANRTIPFEFGDLAGSGDTSVDASALKSNVYYTAPYAPRQHEDTTLRHAQGRRARWLELAAQENKDTLAGYVMNAIRQAMGGAR